MGQDQDGHREQDRYQGSGDVGEAADRRGEAADAVTASGPHSGSWAAGHGTAGGVTPAGSPAAVRVGPRMSLAERLGPAPAEPVASPPDVDRRRRSGAAEQWTRTPAAAEPSSRAPVAAVAPAPPAPAAPARTTRRDPGPAADPGVARVPTPATPTAVAGPSGPDPTAVGGQTVLVPPTLDSATLLRRRPAEPSSGCRRAVAAVTLGTVRPGPGVAEVRRRALVASIRTPITGTHRIAVVSLKGGVGKTTTTIMLGSTLASLRGDRVVAVDGNPDAGTLGDRLARQTTATLRDLLTDHDEIASWSDLARYTSQARSRLEVIANDVDPAVSTAVTAQDYLQVVELLGRYYSVILTDSGTGLLHDAMSGILGCADTLVVVSSAGVDGARSAATTLDWLTAQGHGHLVAGAVTVISAVRPGGRGVDVAAMSRYFASRCRAVVEIPFDRHLEVGAETDLDALAPATRAAYLELARQVAHDFARSGSASTARPGGVPGRAGHRTAPTATFLPG